MAAVKGGENCNLVIITAVSYRVVEWWHNLYFMRHSHEQQRHATSEINVKQSTCRQSIWHGWRGFGRTVSFKLAVGWGLIDSSPVVAVVIATDQREIPEIWYLHEAREVKGGPPNKEKKKEMFIVCCSVQKAILLILPRLILSIHNQGHSAQLRNRWPPSLSRQPDPTNRVVFIQGTQKVEPILTENWVPFRVILSNPANTIWQFNQIPTGSDQTQRNEVGRPEWQLNPMRTVVRCLAPLRARGLTNSFQWNWQSTGRISPLRGGYEQICIRIHRITIWMAETDGRKVGGRIKTMTMRTKQQMSKKEENKPTCSTAPMGRSSIHVTSMANKLTIQPS